MSQNVRRGDKSRGPRPACQWSSAVFTMLQCCRAGHMHSGVAQISPDWLVTWFNALATKEPSEESTVSVEEHWLSTACAHKCIFCAQYLEENHPSHAVSYKTSDYEAFSVVGRGAPLQTAQYIFGFRKIWLCKLTVDSLRNRLLLWWNKHHLGSIFSLN